MDSLQNETVCPVALSALRNGRHLRRSHPANPGTDLVFCLNEFLSRAPWGRPAVPKGSFLLLPVEALIESWGNSWCSHTQQDGLPYLGTASLVPVRSPAMHRELRLAERWPLGLRRGRCSGLHFRVGRRRPEDQGTWEATPLAPWVSSDLGLPVWATYCQILNTLCSVSLHANAASGPNGFQDSQTSLPAFYLPAAGNPAALSKALSRLLTMPPSLHATRGRPS